MSEKDVYIHNYKLLGKLGKGAFSTVFKGEHRINKKLVAIKVEKEATTLKHESKILAYLNRELPGSLNIPTLYWYGLYGNNVCLTTPFYEMSLNQYVKKIDKKQLVGLCEKMITTLRQIHSAFIIHSDIKPDNFMVDSRENLVIIDFGLSSLYYNSEKDVYKENKLCEHMVGSAKYASYNLHMANTISRRDDLISIGYLMLTIFGIELPWSSSMLELEYESMLAPYHIEHPANIQRAKYKKFETLRTYLLELENHYVNNHLLLYLEKVYGLEYEDVPDYASYKMIFS
jgi:serine/threonine protein kinase